MPEAILGVNNELGFRKAATVLDRRDAERVPLRTICLLYDGCADRPVSLAKAGSLICPRRDAKSRGRYCDGRDQRDTRAVFSR